MTDKIIQYSLTGINVYFGEGAIVKLPAELAGLGVKKPLIVTDQGIIKTGIIGQAERQLQESGFTYAIYSGVEPEPHDTMVAEGKAVFDWEQCDGIVAVGGGSCMDTGKCIGIMTAHTGAILDYARSTPDHKLFQQKGVPVICVPTTSGTGSEVSTAAVVTNDRTGRKTTVSSPYLLSAAAILDVSFTAGMPPQVTAYTGMDALCHAIEAYTYETNIRNDVRIVDATALMAIELIAANLVKAYRDGGDMDARRELAWGSMLAGVALNIGAGEAHGLGSMLSKYYGVTHGYSVGVLLPYCMQFNLPFAQTRFAKIAAVMGADISGLSTAEAAQKAVDAVKELLCAVDFPVMSDYIKEPAELDRFAEEAAGNSCCVANKRVFTADDVKQIFCSAMAQN